MNSRIAAECGLVRGGALRSGDRSGHHPDHLLLRGATRRELRGPEKGRWTCFLRCIVAVERIPSWFEEQVGELPVWCSQTICCRFPAVDPKTLFAFLRRWRSATSWRTTRSGNSLSINMGVNRSSSAIIPSYRVEPSVWMRVMYVLLLLRRHYEAASPSETFQARRGVRCRQRTVFSLNFVDYVADSVITLLSIISVCNDCRVSPTFVGNVFRRWLLLPRHCCSLQLNKHNHFCDERRHHYKCSSHKRLGKTDT